MINEKGLCACMKDAWRDGGGYVVAVTDGIVTIKAMAWLVQLPVDLVPRKTLALLVEHIGEIPDDGQAFRCGKKIGAQTLIAAVEQETNKKMEQYLNDTAAAGKVTQIIYGGCSIWQDTNTMEICAVDPEYLRLLDVETDAKAYISPGGQAVSWEDDCKIVIMGVTMNDAVKQYLQGYPWVE